MIEVRDGNLGKGVHATQAIEPGRLILRGSGHRVPGRTRHSFQIDHDVHIVIPNEIELINHSCEPNCGVRVRREQDALEIIALRPIEPGEELTTDYATFEAEIVHMAGPCRCGAPSCRVTITGFAGLPDDRRASFGPFIADYLLEVEAGASMAS